MVEDVLVDERIDDGHRFLMELVRGGIDVSAAAWVKKAEVSYWSLFIGSTAFDGPPAGRPYAEVHAGILRALQPSLTFSDPWFRPTADPAVRAITALRDRHPGGRRAFWYRGDRLGDVAIDRAYIYPRVTTGLTPDEVRQTVSELLARTDDVRPSTVTLRDGTAVRGVPFGLERHWTAGLPSGLEIKLRDAADGSTRVIPADEVANIQ